MLYYTTLWGFNKTNGGTEAFYELRAQGRISIGIHAERDHKTDVHKNRNHLSYSTH